MTNPETSKPHSSRKQRAARARRKRQRAAPMRYEPLPTGNKTAFAEGLLRRLATFSGLVRRCPEPICRRTKRCRGKRFLCQSLLPERPPNPEQDAMVKAKLARMLRQRLAEFEAKREQEGKA